MAGLRKIIGKMRNTKYWELSGLIVLIITYSFIIQLNNKTFLSFANIINILSQIVVFGILSCALAFPMINGTFDLSISSLCALGGTTSALICTKGFYGIKLPFAGAIIVSILICAMFGAINGTIISRTKIPPFIVTLGMDITIRGVVYIVSNNSPVGYLPPEYLALGSSTIYKIPISVLIMALIFLIVSLVLGRTSYGRKIYANGGNYEASYISGVNVKGIRFSTYVISAVLAAIAGILMTARVGSATPNAADSYATTAISSCAMGGVSLSGGTGTVLGIFLGSAMMGMITNGMNLMRIGSNWQMIMKGALMIGAVFYSMWITNTSKR